MNSSTVRNIIMCVAFVIFLAYDHRWSETYFCIRTCDGGHRIDRTSDTFVRI